MLSDYRVTYYRDNLFKLIRFSFPRHGRLCESKDPAAEPQLGGRFLSSLSRSRSLVYQLIVCNDWQYFFTGTIASDTLPTRYNRFTLQNRLSQWIRDKRKERGYERLAYVFVFQRHEDGAWHVHGVVSGLPASAVSLFVPGIHPRKLVEGGYLNWPDYQAKFGFCSMAPLRCPEAVAGYISRYVSHDYIAEEEIEAVGKGNRLVTCSQGLRRAQPLMDFFSDSVELASRLQHHYDFCSTGMVHGVNWAYFLEHADLSDIEFFGAFDEYGDLSRPDQFDEVVYSDYFEQLSVFEDSVFVAAGFPPGPGQGRGT